MSRHLQSLAAILFMLTSCVKNHEAIKDYPIRPVPFTDVKVTDHFWSERMKINREVTIPLAFRKAEETGRIDNFSVAAGRKEGGFCSKYPFDDSDVYKNIEAASYSLQEYPDPTLAAYLDTLIDNIASAQEKDGYLYTNRTIDPAHTHQMAGKHRWEKVEESSHEFYNMGHLYEAAVAHYEATGKRTLLNVAIKNANLIDSLFGWGKIEKAPGHQEIEIGLVKLFRVTGDKKYLDLAKFFLDVRGPGGDIYNQMHEKVINQDVAVGHAVRAQYMYSAMADIAALTGDQSYLDAIDRIWEDVVSCKTYITGGIGSDGNIEGFGEPYDLPNKEAYCETCAAVANALWNYRMFLLHGESKYFDVFEKVLYNGLLSGVSLSGDRFFYPNPLASDGKYSRKEWFGCACCPVNITRFLPSVPGYIYAVKNNQIYVNLFIGNDANLNVNGKEIGFHMVTGFPWDSIVSMNIHNKMPVAFEVLVRIPGWAQNEAFPSDLYSFTDKSYKMPELTLNGEHITMIEKNGYASVDRTWNDGDQLVLTLPLSPRMVIANPKVKADSCKIALQDGPLIYCLEAADQDPEMPYISLKSGTKLQYGFNKDLLNGIGTISGIEYFTSADMQPGKSNIEPFLAVPYYSWANRGEGVMKVWIPAEGLAGCNEPGSNRDQTE